jgi:hypothetical protein
MFDANAVLEKKTYRADWRRLVERAISYYSICNVNTLCFRLYIDKQILVQRGGHRLPSCGQDIDIEELLNNHF